MRTGNSDNSADRAGLLQCNFLRIPFVQMRVSGLIASILLYRVFNFKDQ